MAYKTDRMGRLIDLGKKGARLVVGGPATKEMLKEGPRTETGMPMGPGGSIRAAAKAGEIAAKANRRVDAAIGRALNRAEAAHKIGKKSLAGRAEDTARRILRRYGGNKVVLERDIRNLRPSGAPPKQMTGARKAVKETRALGGTFEGRNSPGARGPRRAGSVITAKIKDITKQQTSTSGRKVHHQTGPSGESVRATREFERGIKKLAKERARG